MPSARLRMIFVRHGGRTLRAFVRHGGLQALVVGLLAPASVCAQVVVGEVAAAGFRASTTGGAQFVVREGQWIPIQARLSLQGTAPFQGKLRFEAADLDGDRVAYRAEPVALTYDPTGPKRVWCYATWLEGRAGLSGARTLDVLSDEGVLLNRLPVPPFDVISGDTFLILDISSGALTKLRTLETPGWVPLDPGWGVRPYYRNVLVSRLEAADLPDRWFGLEAANVIFWDQPDLSDARVVERLGVLKEWVRNGGQLVIGLGKSWPAVQRSELADILPVQSSTIAGHHATFVVERLDQFFEKLVRPEDAGHGGPALQTGESGLHGVEDGRPTRGSDATGAPPLLTQQWHSAPPSRQTPADGLPAPRASRQAGRTFKEPITVAAAEAKPGALRSFRTLTSGGRVLDLIVVGWVGSGRVTVVTASLRDLMAEPVNPAFYAQLLDLNPTTEAFRKQEMDSFPFRIAPNTLALYDAVVGETGFGTGAGVLVLAAFAFVLAYIAVATGASWWWLRRHRLTTLSWTVFAGLAVVASAVSLMAVGVSRGVSRGLRTFCSIDLEGGSPAARVRCYFGYSSPTLQYVDLSLPGEGNYLRSLARGPTGGSVYATPQRYTALPRAALLQDTPMRATLKQFEGFWHGELTGTIRTQLVVDRSTGRVTPDSWVQNDLDVPLSGGYLFYIDPRYPDDNVRIAGQTTSWLGRENVPPALNILAVWVPPLRPGERAGGLGTADYERVVAERARRQRMGREPQDWPDWLSLWDEQQAWIGADSFAPQRGLDAAARSAFLASTRNFYLHCRRTTEGFDRIHSRPITTDGLMELDVLHWLMQGRVRAVAGADDPLLGQAVLLLSAHDPGPVRLYRNGRPLRAVGGRSVYRVRVPLAYEGRPPRGLEDLEP